GAAPGPPPDSPQGAAGAPAAVPALVGVALLVIAVLLARDVLRGGHGESEGGEDVDLSPPSAWRPARRAPPVPLALAVVTYLIFSRGLGIGLPGGPLEGVM